LRGEKKMKELDIPEIDLTKELKKCRSMEDLVGKNGLMQRLFGNIIQQFMEAEMEEHLGREKYERSDSDNNNYRNGHSSKNIKTSFGEVDVPRDRKAEFEPKIIKKYETVCNDLKNRGVKDIILACMDGLKGLPDAIKAVFPDVNIQSCVIHQIRNSIKYVASKER
jgi:transposase-like protein